MKNYLLKFVRVFLLREKEKKELKVYFFSFFFGLRRGWDFTFLFSRTSANDCND